MSETIEAISAIVPEPGFIGYYRDLPEAEPKQETSSAPAEDNLIASRDAAVAKLARYDRFDQAIGAANEAREVASSALRQFFDEERAKLLTWAESSTRENPPARDTERHSSLVADLGNAERACEAAIAVRAAVEPNAAKARVALREIQVKLDGRVAQLIADEGLHLCEQINQSLADVKVKYARVLACRASLYQRAEAFQDNKQPDRAAPFGHAAGRLANIGAQLVIQPSPAEVAEHSSYWGERIRS